MSKAEALYSMVVGGEPKAVDYYVNLKRRIADGQRAQTVYDAIHTVHERRKAMKTRNALVIGADYPLGSYLTPNGKVLTPSAITQLVTLVQAAYDGGTLATNPMLEFASPNSPSTSSPTSTRPPTSSLILSPAFTSPGVAPMIRPAAIATVAPKTTLSPALSTNLLRSFMSVPLKK